MFEFLHCVDDSVGNHRCEWTSDVANAKFDDRFVRIGFHEFDCATSYFGEEIVFFEFCVVFVNHIYQDI